MFQDSGTENSPGPDRDTRPHVVASHVPNRPEVLDHLGPYTQQGPIAALCELSERVWRTYNELTAGYIHSDPNSREYLFSRMLYIAELTSTAVRLNSTWVLHTLRCHSCVIATSKQSAFRGWYRIQINPSSKNTNALRSQKSTPLSGA